MKFCWRIIRARLCPFIICTIGYYPWRGLGNHDLTKIVIEKRKKLHLQNTSLRRSARGLSRRRRKMTTIACKFYLWCGVKCLMRKRLGHLHGWTSISRADDMTMIDSTILFYPVIQPTVGARPMFNETKTRDRWLMSQSLANYYRIDHTDQQNKQPLDSSCTAYYRHEGYFAGGLGLGARRPSLAHIA